MLRIDYKSSGTLLGELVTSSLKTKNIAPKPEFEQRYKDIFQILQERNVFGKDNNILNEQVNLKFKELEVVLNDLWWAVEDTIKLRHANEDDLDIIKQAGFAALKAFELNAKRCDIIREIDDELGESSITFLEKSY